MTKVFVTYKPDTVSSQNLPENVFAECIDSSRNQYELENVTKKNIDAVEAALDNDPTVETFVVKEDNNPNND